MQSSQELRISVASSEFDKRLLAISSEFKVQLEHHESDMTSFSSAADSKITAMVAQLGSVNLKLVELNERLGSQLEAVRHTAESFSQPILGLSSNASEMQSIQSEFDSRLKESQRAVETLASRVAGFVELQARILMLN
jgi:hypothetical protein